MATKISADRVDLPTGVLVAIVLSTAASVGVAAQLLPTDGRDSSLALLGGAVAGALAVGALRSISVRSTTRWMVIIGALMLLHFGSTTLDNATGALMTLAWIVSSVTALVLAARAERWIWRQAVPAASTSSRRRPGGRSMIRIVIVVACLVGAVGIGIGPTMAGGFSAGPRQGLLAQMGFGTSGSPLSATERLDMTRRPRLTDAPVLTVRTDSPGFWRSQTFDLWDGRSWTRSRTGLSNLPGSGAVAADEFDLAATNGTLIEAEFRVEAPYMSALPTAPSAQRVTSSARLVQWEDGSVGTSTPLGRGGRYTVVSRQRRDLTPELLRGTAVSVVPPAVLDRYAQEPVSTERVQQLARRITANAATDFDKVRAIEAWLDDNVEYSLDAPLAPRDADVVDDFLFRSKVGWCEQIASSLTVMLRSVGVPARLATGYVPGDRDPITRTYTVRERDAHAWTEVWFPDVGWVPFDPTVGVDLGAFSASDTVATTLATYGPWVLLAVAIAVGFGLQVVDAGRRAGRRLAEVRLVRRTRRESTRRGAAWPDTAEAVLERIGERWGRPRAPSETTSTYARHLADRVGDDRLPEVGTVVDRARYAGTLPDEAERTAIADVLESIPDPPG